MKEGIRLRDPRFLRDDLDAVAVLNALRAAGFNARLSK